MESKRERRALLLSQLQNAREPELTELSREELTAYLRQLHTQLEQLDALEPRSENCEDYDEWADVHEIQEDRIDEVMDRLDELK